MSTTRARQRKFALIALGALAGVLLIANMFAGRAGGGSEHKARFGEAVFEGFGEQLGSARIIRVRLGDLTYTLKRAAPESEDWVMIEAGSYPVRADRLAALAEGLTSLRWGERRTEDPAKFDRIGVGDPANGGSGAYIEVLGEGEMVLASLITGRRGSRIYARRPDETVSFRVNGNLPPLYTREAWLDFDIVDMMPEVIAAVRITEASGRSLFLRRVSGGGPRDFVPSAPNESDRLISRLAASGPALATSRLAPIDAKPAAALESRPVGRHVTLTHDGLEVDISAYREPDGFFITLRAIEAGEGARRAETINQRAEGWAFELTEFDWNEFTPPVNAIVRRTR